MSTWTRRRISLMAGCAAVALMAPGGSLAAALAAAPPVPVGANNITVDGRTLTQVSTSGSVTNITTKTIAGGNAFNSFNNFTVAEGNTVNLQVPGAANNLINLVHASPVEINGILNSYKNGAIGGNIYFADPYGMVVGKTGAVNVGSLSVSTPTAAFLDSVIGADGSVNQAAVAQLLSGNIPLSPDGVVTIAGKVNARDAVRVLAASASVSGAVTVSRAATAQELLFSKSVNAQGLQSGTALVSKGGVIEIVAAGNATVDGTVTADASAAGAAGVVQIEAGGDIAAGAGAVLSASALSGSGDGGHVRVYAGRNLTVAQGAQFLAKAAGLGAGGTIEASAAHTAIISGGIFDASSPEGQAGSVVFDPTDLYIGAAVNANGADQVDASIYSPGTNVTLSATNSITVASGYEINTRTVANGANADTAASTGNSGDISLTAPNITIDGALRADAASPFTAGVITLTASGTQDAGVDGGTATQTTGITIGGVIEGGAIVAKSTSTATSGYSDSSGGSPVLEKASSLFGSAAGSTTGDFAIAIAGATAGVTLDGTAQLVASGTVGSTETVAAGTVDLESSATEESKANFSISALSAMNQATPIEVAAAYGGVTGTSTVAIDSGASVDAAGTLTVRAYNSDSLHTAATAKDAATNQNTYPNAVAYSSANVTTTATISGGATINAGNVAVIAHNDNSFKTDAEAEANSQGVTGIAVAVADLNTQASANEYASLGNPTGGTLQNVTVEADSITTTNATDATTGLGSTLMNAESNIGASSLNFLSSNKGVSTAGGGNSANPSSFLLSSSIAVADSTQGATADIATDPNTVGASAPQITASGAVAVNSQVDDEGIRSDAVSKAKSTTPNTTSGTSSSSSGSLAVSAAVAIGLYTHNTLAYIGDGVHITAADIGVGAETNVPATINWNLFSDIASINTKIGSDISNLKPYVNTNLGVIGSVLTSYASATVSSGSSSSSGSTSTSSSGSSVDIAGAVNYFSVTDNTKAWVGDGAQLKATGSGSWTTTLDTSSDTADTSKDPNLHPAAITTVGWLQPLTVGASNLVDTIDIAGDISFTPPFKGTSAGSTGTAVGGAFNYIGYTDNTISGIDGGANITSTNGVAVNADGADTVYGISPTSGSGSSIAANGIVALTEINDTTHASISNAANVTAPVVTIEASDGLNLWSIAGAIGRGSSAGVGIAIAINEVTTDTEAYVGDNSSDDPISGTGDSDPAGGGYVNTGELDVKSHTDGMVGAISVAASQAKSSSDQDKSPSTGKFATLKNAITGFGSNLKNSASNALSKVPILNALTGTAKTDNSQASTEQSAAQQSGNQDPSASNSESQTPSGGSGTGPQPSFGLAISGSASVNDSNRTTKAYLDGATVENTNGSDKVDVQAVDFTGLVSASGAAALVQANSSKSNFSVGVAGVVALALGNDTTQAYIDSSNLSNADTVSVEALRGGYDVAVGLGLAVNSSSNQQNSASVAVSASLALITDLTDAHIWNSTVTGNSGDTGRNVTVEAYNNDGILIGGGAIYAKGQYGIGLALTYAQITDPTDSSNNTLASTQASIEGSSVTNYDTVTALADSAQEIGTGAGSGGVSTASESIGISGAFNFNNIGTTTAALVSGSTIDATGQVGVNATGADNSGLDNTLDSLLPTTENLSTFQSGFDFLGSAVGGGNQPGASVVAVAAVIQVQTGGGSNAGVADVENFVSDSYQANVTGSTVNAGGLTVGATDDTYILAIAFGVGVATGDFSGVGSVTANVITDSATATLGDPTATSKTTNVTANTVDVSATDSATIWSLAGGVAVAPSGTAVGAAIAYNEIGTPGGASTPTAGAEVDNAAITLTSGSATPELSITSSETGSIKTLSVAGGFSGGDAAVAGSISLNIVGDTSTATLENSSVVTTPATTTPTSAGYQSACSTNVACSLNVSAGDGTTIDALAGSVAGSSEAAVGVSFAVNVITDTTKAEASNASWAVPNGVSFDANSTATIYSLAIGGGGSGTLAIFGSNTDNVVNDQTTASLSGITQGDSPWLNVSAEDNAQISSLAGSISGAGDASVGLAIAVNVITDGAHATISNSSLDVPGSLTDDSSETATIESMAVAGGGAGDAAIGGSVTTNVIANTAEAGMTNVGLGNGQGDDNANVTTIQATDTPTIKSLAGSVQFGGAAGVGIAIAVNVISDTTHAYMDGSGTTGAAFDGGNILINANSNAGISTIAVGAAISGEVAAAGSVAVNVLTDNVTAEIAQGAQVQAEDNVGVEASNTDTINTYAGDLALSATTAGVGIGVTTNYLAGNTTADISGPDTSVTALGNGAPLQVADGTLVSPPDVTSVSGSVSAFAPPSLSENTKNVSGIAVNAQSLRTLTDVNMGASVALDPLGSAAVNVQAGVNILGGTTKAYIDQADVTAGTGAPANGSAPVSDSLTPGVDVNASSHDFAANFVVGAAGSANVAVAGTFGVNVFDSTTQAYIDASTIESQGDVGVRAVSSQDSAALVGGLSAGLVGVGGTGAVNVFNADTEASVDGGSVTAADLTVKATSESSMQMIGGTVSIGGAAVAGTILVGVSEDTTKAYIGDTGQTTTLTVPGVVTVEADNTSTLDTLAVSAGAGGTGVAAMASVNVDSATTDANIYDVNLNQATGQAAASEVQVKATNTLTINAYAGSLAVGGAGWGGSVNVVYLMPVTNAGISDSDINATTVDVTATGDKTINEYTVTGAVGVGSVGIAASIGVIIVDEPTAGSSDGQLSLANSQDQSTLGNANTLAGGNYSGTADTTVQNSTIISQSSPNTSRDLNTATGGTGTTVNSGGQGNGTAATISGGTITASSVTVSATDKTSTTNVAGAVGIGGDVGASAGIAVTSVNGSVSAEITSGTNLDVSGAVQVTALAEDGSAGHAAEVDAYTGGAGIGAGATAGAAVALINNNVTATLDGTLGTSSAATGSDSAQASDTSTINTNADGGAVGLGAGVGVMVAYASKTSTVTASATPSAEDYVGGLTIGAQDSGTVTASGVGAAGGIGGAASGVGATASDTSTVNAYLAGGSAVNVDGGEVLVEATSIPETSASTFGVTVAGGVSIGASVATAQATPTVTAYVGANATITGSGSLSINATSEPLGYGPNNTSGTDPVASASATAGSGALLGSADAAVAVASDNATVNAYTGTGVTLPDGDVGINAVNASNQSSNATGVAVGGILALGGAVATSEAGNSQTGNGQAMATTATLGDNAKGSAHRTGSLSLLALGSDLDQASTTAGSGGLVAGAAAVSTTSDNANVTAALGTLGSQANPFVAGSVVVDAFHSTGYGAGANALNAAAVGASGSSATNSANVNVTTNIGDIGTNESGNVYIATLGSVAISAQDVYVEDMPSGVNYSAQGAAGGVANAAAALSTTSLTGTALVNLGQSDMITSGSSATGSAGGITIAASDMVTTNDQVDLETGGAIAGAGVNDQLTANLTNTVNIDNYDYLSSYGNVGAGTYSMVNVGLNAYVSTWGGVAVGSASATGTVTVNEAVNLGTDVTINAAGNVDLTPGQYPNPLGLYNTAVDINAIAQGYVRGLIAIPYASATGNAAVNDTLFIDRGDTITSGQNTVVGAYPGTPTITADGTGHGYELGFIPATNHDSNANPPVTTATVTIDGTITAGIYNTLQITIPDCASSSQGFCDTFTQASGLSLGDPSQYYDPNFNPHQLIDANQTGVQQQALDNNTPAGTVGAFVFPSLYAAGGSVTINASKLSGSGTITAQGGPSITVIDNSPDYVVIGSATIPTTGGGEIFFTGAADQTQAPYLRLDPLGAGKEPSILIHQAYSGTVGGFGAAVFVTGEIDNLNGSVTIQNDQGSIGQFGTVKALQFVELAPNGVITIGSPNTAIEFLGASPDSEWFNYMIWPGGNPDLGQTPNANWAIAYVANSMYGYGTTNQNTLNYNILQNIYNTNNGTSTVFYQSNCLPANSGSCQNNPGYASSNSPNGSAYAINPSDCCNQFYFPGVPIVSLAEDAQTYYSPNSQNVMPGISGVSSSQSSTISGREVLVQAQIIDVSGTISGANTDWSVNLPSSLTAPSQTFCFFGFCVPIGGGQITLDQWEYQHFGGNPKFAISGLQDVNAGDSVINAAYNAQTNSIVVDKVNAAAVGGFIYLNGGIISTNPLGTVHLNSGLGHVTINNQTGDSLTLQEVNAGALTSAQQATSVVEIEDQFKPQATNTTWYVYDPTVGKIAEYLTSNGANYVGSNLLKTVDGSSATYDPLAGMRWNWNYSASLYRNVTIDYSANPVSNWVWNSSSNNPWTEGGGYLTFGSSDSLPVFQESISGGASGGQTGYIAYHGCGGSYGSSCNFGFLQTVGSGNSPHCPCAYWDYYFPGNAYLNIDLSVKADNAIGVSFGGNATGLININSNAPVTIGGPINNPDGSTTITADGNISEIPFQGSILSQNLSLIATNGSVGTTVQPLSATLASGGVLTVSAGNQGVSLNLGGGALINQVNASDGAVVINANGNLDPQTPGQSFIGGRTITIDNPGGGVGQNGQLVLQPLHDNSAGSAVVDISALGDINIKSLGGDLLIGKQGIVSSTGNVTIDVPNGAILDASNETAGESLTQRQLQTIWNDLHLLGSDAQDNATKLFEKQIDSYYQQYWLLLQNGSVSNGAFTLNSAVVPNFLSLAAAYLKLDPATVTAADAQTYANDLYQSLTSTFSATFGSTWQSLSEFQSYQAAFQYQATAQQSAQQGQAATWTLSQLEDTVDVAALGTGTPVGVGNPNVSGRDISLTSGGSLGELLKPLQINVTDLLRGSLSSRDAAALAVATTPGSIDQSHVITQVENGVETATGGYILVNQTAPLFVAASGTFNGASNGTIYLQSTAQDLELGKVTALGNINLVAPASILSAGNQFPNILTPGDVTLQAGSGSIGVNGTPITLSIGGRLLSAVASQGVYAEEVPSTGYVVTSTTFCIFGICFTLPTGIQPVSQDADLTVTQIYAPNGTVDLNSTDGSILADPNPPASFTLSGLSNITATNITLNAKGDIGSISGAAPVTVDLGSSGQGELDGTAGGQIYLYSPNDALHVGTLQAGGDLYLTTALGYDLTAQDLISTGGSINAAAGGSEGIANTSAPDGSVTLTAVEQSNANITFGTATDGGSSSGGPFVVNVSHAFTTTPGVQISTGSYISVNATSIDMGAGSTLSAKSYVDLTTSGDMTLGQVTSSLSNGVAFDLTSGGGIFGNGDGNPNLILAGNSAVADLVSGGDVGATSLPFAIDGNGTGDELTGNITGAGTIAIDPPAPFDLGNVTSANDLNITANAELDVLPGSVIESTAGNVNVTATALAMGAGSLFDAAQAVNLTATAGGITLGQVMSDASNGTGITLTAAGNIYGNGDGSPNIVLLGDNAVADITTTNGGNLGTGSVPSTFAGPVETGYLPITVLQSGSGNLLNGTVSGAAYLTSGSNALAIGTFTSGGDLGIITGGDLNAGSLTSTGGSVDASIGGSGDINSTSGAKNVVLIAANDLTLNSVTSGGDMGLIAGGKLMFQSLSVGGNIMLGNAASQGSMTIQAGGEITFQNLSSVGNMSLVSKHDDVLQVPNSVVTAGGNGTFSGVGIIMYNVTVAGTTSLTAAGPVGATDDDTTDPFDPTGYVEPTAGDIDVTSLTSGGTVTASAAGSINVPTLTSTSGSVDLTAGGNVAITTLSAGQNINSVAGGTTNVATGTSGGSMSLISGGAISYQTLLSGGDMTLISQSGDVTGTTVTAGGNATLSGVGISFQTLNSGGATELAANGPLSGSDPVAGNILIGQYVQGVGDITADAVSGSITGPQVTSTNGSITLTAGTLAGNGMVPNVPGENIEVTTLSAGQNIASNAGGTTYIQTGSSGGSTEISSGGPVTFVTLKAGGNMSVTSETADMLGVTANAGGNANFTGLGVSLLTETSGGAAGFDAYGPISASDPYAGNVIVNNVQAGGDIMGLAAGSIFVPTMASTSGSIILTAGQDIEIPTLSAGGNISTTATAGITNVNTASAGGSLDMSAGQTITFYTLTSGGDMSVVSKNGFVLGLVDGDGENQSENWIGGAESSEPGTALLDDGSATAGGAITMAGVGVSVANLTAGKGLSLTAYGIVPPATAALGANEPNLADAAVQLGNVQADLALTPPDVTDALSGLNAALLDLAHGTPVASASVAPTYFGNLATTLQNVVTALGGSRQPSLGDDLPGDGTLPASEFVSEADSYGSFAQGGLFFDALNAGGNMSLTSGTVIDGEQLTSTGAMTINAGTALTAATAPLPQDAAMGSILVDGISGAGGVTGTAYGSILTDFVTAQNGSIGLTAGLDIKVPTLTAGQNISTFSGGVTNVETATAGGSISMTAVGPLTFVTLTAGQDIAATSLTGDVLGVTATAGGDASFDGMGVSMLTLTAGGSTALDAYGPLSATDPYAGEIIIDQVTSGGSLSANSFASILIPTLTAGGSVGLVAGQDIEIPTFTAGGSIATDAAGVTNFSTAMAGGSISIFSGGTITFHTLTAGGDVSATSVDGNVLGLTDQDEEGGFGHEFDGESDGHGEHGQRTSGDSLLDDGSIIAGGSVNLAGVGVHFADLTAGGNVTVTAYGIGARPTEEDYAADKAAWAAGTPDLNDGGPRMLDALYDLTDLQRDGSAAAPNTADMVFDLNDALLDLTHFRYTLTTTPTYMANLVATLHDVAAGFLPGTAEELAEHPNAQSGLDTARGWEEAFAAESDWQPGLEGHGDEGDYDNPSMDGGLGVNAPEAWHEDGEGGPDDQSGIVFHDLTAGGSVTMTSGSGPVPSGDIDDSGKGDDRPTVQAGIYFDDLTAGGDVTLTSGAVPADADGDGPTVIGGIYFDNLASGGNVALTLGTVPSDPGDGAPFVQGGIFFDDMTAGGNVVFTSDGAVHGEELAAGGVVTATMLQHNFHIDRIRAQKVVVTFYDMGDHDSNGGDAVNVGGGDNNGSGGGSNGQNGSASNNGSSRGKGH